MKACNFAFRACLVVLSMPMTSRASDREPMDEAWWTGPLLAASASTLPQGHVLFEPYLFDIHGVSHGTEHSNDFGSQSYLNYGVTDRFTVGLIPRFSFDEPVNAPSSSGVRIDDLTAQAQYRLTQFEEGHWLPTISMNVQETLPTGSYEHLERASDGVGAGAYTTNVALYSQSYFWMPNGRILRARLDLTYSLPNMVKLADRSDYGTTDGFVGNAHPGRSVVADLAFEYSVTRHWVIATDLWYERDGATRLFGLYPPDAATSSMIVRSSSPITQVLYIAPALEYNWNAQIGIILGARVTAAGRNETATVTPVIAINLVI
jgi:hypothetical protein